MYDGDLRDRVTIQTPTLAADAQGGRTTTWATLATVWALVAGAGANAEPLAAAAVTASAQYTVTLRYRYDVTAMMRLSWTPYRYGSAKTLQVHSVMPSHDRAWVKLECSEVQS